VPVRWVKSIKRHEKLEKEIEERQRSSGVAGKGGESPGSPESRVSGSSRIDDPAHKDANESSHGGQHGVERHLPEPNSIGKEASNVHANTNLDLIKGHVVGPVPSNILNSNKEDIVSSTGSGDHLAQELVEDVGVSFAKSGQALAKGLS